jgi:hypothetical protein
MFGTLLSHPQEKALGAKFKASAHCKWVLCSSGVLRAVEW